MTLKQTTPTFPPPSPLSVTHHPPMFKVPSYLLGEVIKCALYQQFLSQGKLELIYCKHLKPENGQQLYNKLILIIYAA